MNLEQNVSARQRINSTFKQVDPKEIALVKSSKHCKNKHAFYEDDKHDLGLYERYM